MNKGTKGDMYTKEIISRILDEGCLDKNPRPHWEDGTPAYSYSVNHGICTYDLTKNESPLITLRPIATKSSVGELLWIYQDQSNDLDLLADKYNVTWWDKWDIGNRAIGSCYGETVRKHNSLEELLYGLETEPDGRRHMICLWQTDDFKEPHGLKPCAFLTMWNVRHGRDGVDYLDMCLVQRSSDFITAGCINQVQYLVFQHLVARHVNMTPGRFTWFYDNIQIYDRHVEIAKELLKREPIDCDPKIILNEDKHNFFDFKVGDVKIEGYPREKIKKLNPQITMEIAI